MESMPNGSQTVLKRPSAASRSPRERARYDLFNERNYTQNIPFD